MTIEAPWDVVRSTPNRSPRQNVPRLGCVLHHGAIFSLSELRRLEMGAKQVSSTAIVEDDVAELMIPSDGDRAWSLSDAWWDSALRSIETVNLSANGWTISDASHETLAHAVAYWSEREGWWPHRDGDPATWTVLGHRELYTIHGASYATACPGGMDLARITRRAQEIRNGDDLMGYKDWPQEDKLALIGDIWGTGVMAWPSGIPEDATTGPDGGPKHTGMADQILYAAMRSSQTFLGVSNVENKENTILDRTAVILRVVGAPDAPDAPDLSDEDRATLTRAADVLTRITKTQ